MTRAEIIKEIRAKKTFLCVGLDPDVDKLPKHLLEEDDPIFEFNRQIIDATAEYCVSFKPNTAFYEAYGVSGYTSLERTIKYIRQNYPHHFLIADAKRGDIGNTSAMYAKAFFKRLHADAITIAPYMGSDSVKPFLEFDGKWAIVLALTSNEGSRDFQMTNTGNGTWYEQVLKTSSTWGTIDNMMYVIGATKADMLADVRKIIPQHFLLVPGVGTQGGSLAEVCKYGLIPHDIGLLVNSSRAILYASSGEDFATAAAAEAKKIALEMKAYF
ncbi:MAG: orotidine 5-phosphate decarboxylase [Bacteroidota bacterium]|jgi:orotidine-5'-phosphate decarboxylase|nr:orotidine 5-phosphate decarboxylase [Bacteroidota bacterium]